MAIAKETEVRAILTSDREKKIREAYRSAWADWWTSDDRQKLSRWPRTRANNIFEYLATHLISEFQSDKEARFICERETFKLLLEERLLIRFKKSNSNGVGSNIGTLAELDFCDPQVDWLGFPELQKVEIVYTLNLTGSDLSEITVLARDGDQRQWSYEITGGEAEVFQFVQPQPLKTGIDVEKEVEKMVTRKKVSKTSEEGNG